MIRIATAHAKARLSNFVQDQDATAAINILKFALFKEAPKPKSRSKRARMDQSMMGESDSDDSDDDDEDRPNPRMSINGSRRSGARAGAAPTTASKGKTPLRTPNNNQEDVEMMDVDEAADEIEEELLATRRASRRSQNSASSNIPSQGSSTNQQPAGRYVPGGAIHPSRMALFKSRINVLMMSSDGSAVQFEDALSTVNKKLEINELFGPAEATAILEKLGDENKIMFTGTEIYLI